MAGDSLKYSVKKMKNQQTVVFLGDGMADEPVAELGGRTPRQAARTPAMDTNARNARARAMYRRLGYREAGIAPCVFNGIPGVELVCLEKSLEDPAGSLVLIDGYDRTEEIGALFAEYTDLLIEGDPKFRE